MKHYTIFYDNIILKKPRNLEVQRINCTAQEVKATGKQFSK